MKVIFTLLIALCATFVFCQSTEVIKKADVMPKYTGCEGAEFPNCTLEKLRNYIFAELKYPTSAQEKKVEGTAVIQFIVRKDGSLTDIVLSRDPGEGCGPEALRVFQKMAMDMKWIPGEHNGEIVDVSLNLPVQFRL